MTTGGWIILIISVGMVTALFAWCIYKVFTAPVETEHMHGMKFETPDEKSDKKESD